MFDVPNAYRLDDRRLIDALRFRGGRRDAGARILLRQAVAALLNASHPDVDYPRATTEIVTDVNAALASRDRGTILELARELNRHNTRGCSLD